MRHLIDLFGKGDLEMNSLEWRVYNLIKEVSLAGHKITQKEICDNIDELVYNDDDKSHDHCGALWGVINRINQDPSIDKIIISKNFEYWIGNEEETIEYLNTLWGRITPKLTRYWQLVKKTKLEGQGKLLSNNLQPIDDNSNARPYHEVFMNIAH